MKTKTLLTLAIITTLPFSTMADTHIGPVGGIIPTGKDGNGHFQYPNNAVLATDDPIYETVTIDNGDKTNIASTAYVKGAYNDTIAAMNKIVDIVESDLSRASMVIDENNIPLRDAKVIATTETSMKPTQDIASVALVEKGMEEAIRLSAVEVYITWGSDNQKTEVRVQATNNINLHYVPAIY